MDEDSVMQNLIYIILATTMAAFIAAAISIQSQPEAAHPQSKYMMDDYGNIYSVQPCQSCQSCFEFHKVDTAEIKVKAFDFVPK